jgi:hypothetical protein
LDSPEEGNKKLCRNIDSYLHSDMAVYLTKLKIFNATAIKAQILEQNEFV